MRGTVTLDQLLQAVTPDSQERAAMTTLLRSREAQACAHKQDSGPDCVDKNYTACPTGALEVVSAYVERVMSLTVAPKRERGRPFHAGRPS